jgi:crotonobetainyl-CoA:carnitine CoA-transferase CaiB-like acyl-CoA transferase
LVTPRDDTESSGALAGIVVVEFSQFIAGPSAALLLADYGAEVIKVEPPSGDGSRAVGAALTPPGEPSPTFAVYNRNKRLRTIDLGTPAGRAEALALVDRADVVIESARPGAMVRLGLGPSDIQDRNPRTVYASVSGFGWHDASAQRPGVDFIVQAESGIMSLTGPMGGPPTKVGFSVVDAATGHALCHGILAALFERERTGRAPYVRVALRDVAVQLEAVPLAEYLVTGTLPARVGNEPLAHTPTGVYPCAIGAIAIGLVTEAHWLALLSGLGREDLGHDPRFATKERRIENRVLLRDVLTEQFAREPAFAWVEILRAAGLTAGQVKDLGDVVADLLLEGRLIEAMPETAVPAVRNPVELVGRAQPVPWSGPRETWAEGSR